MSNVTSEWISRVLKHCCDFDDKQVEAFLKDELTPDIWPLLNDDLLISRGVSQLGRRLKFFKLVRENLGTGTEMTNAVSLPNANVASTSSVAMQVPVPPMDQPSCVPLFQPTPQSVQKSEKQQKEGIQQQEVLQQHDVQQSVEPKQIIQEIVKHAVQQAMHAVQNSVQQQQSVQHLVQQHLRTVQQSVQQEIGLPQQHEKSESTVKPSGSDKTVKTWASTAALAHSVSTKSMVVVPASAVTSSPKNSLMQQLSAIGVDYLLNDKLNVVEEFFVDENLVCVSKQDLDKILCEKYGIEASQIPRRWSIERDPRFFMTQSNVSSVPHVLYLPALEKTNVRYQTTVNCYITSLRRANVPPYVIRFIYHMLRICDGHIETNGHYCEWCIKKESVKHTQVTGLKDCVATLNSNSLAARQVTVASLVTLRVGTPDTRVAVARLLGIYK